jgi:hypothetical protein
VEWRRPEEFMQGTISLFDGQTEREENDHTVLRRTEAENRKKDGRDQGRTDRRT